jgi:hypothetical protein
MRAVLPYLKCRLTPHAPRVIRASLSRAKRRDHTHTHALTHATVQIRTRATPDNPGHPRGAPWKNWTV